MDNRVSNLENLVQQLSTRLADVSAELDAVKKETTSKSNVKDEPPDTPLGGQNDRLEKNKEKPTKNSWPFKFSEQQTGVTTEGETDSGTNSAPELNEGTYMQISPVKDTSNQTSGENSTIMDINNLKTKVDNLEKIVRHQSDSADSNLVETLEN